MGGFINEVKIEQPKIKFTGNFWGVVPWAGGEGERA